MMEIFILFQIRYYLGGKVYIHKITSYFFVVNDIRDKASRFYKKNEIEKKKINKVKFFGKCEQKEWITK